MADIGNRHHQAVIAAHFFGKHGIVKVARGFTINGDQRQLAQIHAVFAFGRFHIGRNLTGRFHASGGEFVWQMVFAYRNFNFHTAVSIVTQNLRNLACGRQIFFRITGQFHIDDLPVFGVANAAHIQNNALGDAFVFGYGHSNIAFFGQTSHHRGVGTLNDVQHLAFTATTSVNAYRPHSDYITMHQATHLTLVQNQIGVAVFFVNRNSKTKAIAVCLDAAFDQGQFLSHTHQAAAVDVDLAIAHHRT